MTLLKTSLLNGISVGIRLGSALITNKTLALFVGPTGYAAIGQFQNSLSIAMSLSGGLLATGVTKATAEHFDNEDRQHLVWQTAFRIALITSLAIAFSLFLFREWLTIEILQRQDFSSIFVWLALATPTIVTHLSKTCRRLFGVIGVRMILPSLTASLVALMNSAS